MNTKTKNYRKPSAQRKIGAYALKNYALGGFVALLYIVFVSVPILSEYSTEVEYIGKPPPVNQEILKPAQTPEQRAIALYPMSVVAVNDNEYIDLSTIRVRENIVKIKAYILEWEKQNNRKFLPDYEHMGEYYSWGGHPSMHSVIQPEYLKIEQGKSRKIEPLQYNKDDIITTFNFMSFDFAIKPTIDRFYIDSNEQKKFLIGGSCAYYGSGGFYTIECGKEWKDFITGVYHAKTEQDYRDIDPLYQWGLILNADVDRRKANTQQAINEIQEKRAGYVALLTKKESVINNEWDNLPEEDKPLTTDQREALRVTSLSGAMIILIIYLLSGHKYGFIKKPRFISKRFYLFSLPFLAVYFYFLTVDNVSYSSSFWVVFLTLVPPFLLFTSFNIYMGVVEYIKETDWYIETFVLGKGGSARWGGILSYIKYDFTRFMRGEEKEEGGIYCGRTKWQYDLKIGGRDIGLNTHSMMLTVAKTGGGKSHYMAWNELLSWKGGAFIFDPKGEHTERTYSVRSKTAPFYTLDPLKGVDPRAEIPLSCYNPLDDIDLDSPSASAELLQIMQAGIYEEKNEGANSKYFRDKAVEIGLGYLVHLLTSYDKKFHNLPCFYNLFLMGSPDGVGIDETAERVLLAKMSVNEAIGKAPINAAKTLKDAGEKGELGGIKNSFSNGFNWVNEDAIKPLLMRSDFSMKEIRTKDATVSVVIHMNHIDDPRLIKWLRVLIAMGLQASKIPTTSGLKSLFMIDEFAQLGTFDPIKKGLVKLRSQNVKIHMFLQDLGQLKDNYDNYTQFMSSCDKQFFAINDEYTAEKISSLLGEYREEHHTGVEEKGLHYNQMMKKLRPMEEVLRELREKSGVQYIFPSEGNPMLLKLVPFTKNFKKYGKVYDK